VNIIVNACEAMSQGGSISIAESTEDHPLLKQAVIRIRDSGPGISAAVLVKSSALLLHEGGRHGAGPGISQRIISEHRGRLEVESTAGEGAEFILCCRGS
jgi:signal transduction histidine kinase